MEKMSENSFLPSLDIKSMSDESKKVFKELDVVNEDGQFEITKLSKFLELNISVRERV
jgi:hypothetical protein